MTHAETPSLSRAGRHCQETRERLLPAAHRLIARKGLDAASIAEITEEAAVGGRSLPALELAKETTA